jgi:hypothetical protein
MRMRPFILSTRSHAAVLLNDVQEPAGAAPPSSAIETWYKKKEA